MTAHLRLSRAFNFARHIPVRQIVRRLQLAGKRTLADNFWPAPSQPRPYERLPGTLLKPAPRHSHGTLERCPDGWCASFLGDTVDMKDTVAWFVPTDDKHVRLWRMNLHYFEYLRDLAVDDALALIADWIIRVRPRNKRSSFAGWTPYAISLRLSSWLDWWSVNADKISDAAFTDTFAASICEQADYLLANIETDVGGNHLIKNVRALWECSAVFADERSARWRAAADRLLQRELPVQVLMDGLHFERSPSYHAQVFSDLLAICALRPRDAWTETLEERLDKMGRTLQLLTHPDMKIAQFGDSGLSMAIGVPEILEAWAQARMRPIARCSGVFALPEGGYYGARSGGDYLIVKMGPLGANALMAHAHGDWGSFEWSLNAQRVIVDQGVFEYFDGDRRRASRSTASHNTASLDNVEQADFFGGFRCGVRPNPLPPHFCETPDGFTLEGELSPSRHPRGARQRRRISLSGRSLRIEDEALDGHGMISARLLLHPSIQTEAAGRNRFLLRCADGLRLFATAELGEMRMEPAVWWPDMGREESTRRLVIEGANKTLVQFTEADE